MRKLTDGLTFYYGNWDPMAVLAGGEGIRFVPENFGAIDPPLMSEERLCVWMLLKE